MLPVSFDEKYQCEEVPGVCFVFEDQGQFELLLGSEGRITKIVGGLMRVKESIEGNRYMYCKLDELELGKFFINLLNKKLLVEFINEYEEIKKIIKAKNENFLKEVKK